MTTPQRVQIGEAELWLGDNRDVLSRLPDASIDAIVTDPPYGLRFIGGLFAPAPAPQQMELAG